MRGSCGCNNLQLTWHTRDYSLVPRACQCEYCLPRKAAYVSKSGTTVEVRIHNENLHRISRHGSNSARFHECSNCGDLVLVTAEIEGELYGVLNANCLRNPLGFPDSVKTDFSGQAADEKRRRWRQNWCCPVTIRGPGGKNQAREANDGFE